MVTGNSSQTSLISRLLWNYPSYTSTAIFEMSLWQALLLYIPKRPPPKERKKERKKDIYISFAIKNSNRHVKRGLILWAKDIKMYKCVKWKFSGKYLWLSTKGAVQGFNNEDVRVLDMSPSVVGLVTSEVTMNQTRGSDVREKKWIENFDREIAWENPTWKNETGMGG
jgi:hypothetical protein